MPEETPVHPEVAEALAAIAAEREAKAANAARSTEAEEARVSKLNEIKARVEAAVGPIAEALAKAVDEAERTALIELEAKVFEPFREELERAYLEFAGQRAGDSNPSGPEGALESHVAVTGNAQA